MQLLDDDVSFFLALLRAGLWSRPIDPEFNRPAPIKVWNRIFELSSRHAVLAIVYDGLLKLSTSNYPPRPLLVKWTIVVNRIEAANKRMNVIIADQVAFFFENELSPVLLKGQGLAQYYTNPLHRICGDIDWYFHGRSAFEKAAKIISKQGIHVERPSTLSLSYGWSGVEVEHHRQAVDLFSPLLNREIKRPTARAFSDEPLIIGGKAVIVLSRDMNLLQVCAHILKHMLSFGIGLRQFCDAAILFSAYAGKYDHVQFEKLCRSSNIKRWIDHLHVLLVQHLGLDELSLPFRYDQDLDVSWMLEDVIRSGEFGFHDHRFVASGGQGSGRVNRRRRVVKSLTRYGRLAPYEALSFPIYQFFSKANQFFP